MSTSELIVLKINEILADPKYHDIIGILNGTKNGVIYGAKLRFCHALVMSFLFRSGPVKDRWTGILKNTKQHAKSLGSFVFIYKTMLYLLKLLRNYRSPRKQPSSSSSTTTTLDEINTHAYPGDAFISGLVAGFAVFGYPSPSYGLSSINQQMVLYVFSRIFLGLCKWALDQILVRMSSTSPLTPHQHHQHNHHNNQHKHHKHVKGAIGEIDFNVQTRRLSKNAEFISNASWSIFASLCWATVMYLFRKDSTLLQSSMIHSMKYLYVDSESWKDIWDII